MVSVATRRPLVEGRDLGWSRSCGFPWRAARCGAARRRARWAARRSARRARGGRRGAPAAAGAMPVAALHRLGKLGRMRGREATSGDRRVAPAAAPGGDADRAVRIDQLAGRCAAPSAMVRRGLVLARRARHRTARARGRAHPRSREAAGAPRTRPSARATVRAVAAAQIEQQALEVARDLDVHARAGGRHDRAGAGRRRSRRSAPGCRCGWSRRSAGRSAGPSDARRSRRRRRRNCRSARRRRPVARARRAPAPR